MFQTTNQFVYVNSLLNFAAQLLARGCSYCRFPTSKAAQVHLFETSVAPHSQLLVFQATKLVVDWVFFIKCLRKDQNEIYGSVSKFQPCTFLNHQPTLRCKPAWQFAISLSSAKAHSGQCDKDLRPCGTLNFFENLFFWAGDRGI